jgi:hypothetical protein
MISYESSKWYIKMWRKRWYLYAIFLHIKVYMNIDIILNFVIDDYVDYEKNKKIRQNWKDIRKHVELTKMSKYT